MRHRASTRVGALAVLVALASLPAVADAAPVPTWDKIVSRSSSRFKVLKKFANEAVLDKETGLVWERAPAGGSAWSGAQDACYNISHGNRKGWRLPTLEELASLVDATQANPSLPLEHPFSNIGLEHYWSSTTDSADPARARVINFATGAADTQNKTAGGINRWCVRGGRGHDAL